MYWSTHQYQMTGNSHLQQHLPCQDMVMTYVKNGLSVLVLADGLSSCANSHFGASIVCQTTLNYFVNTYHHELQLRKNFEKELIQRIRQELSNYAKIHKIKLSSLQSTLNFVVYDHSKYVSGRIGDGVIGIYSNGVVSILSQEVKSDAVELTDTILSKDIEHNLDIHQGDMKDVWGFIVMSDGTANALIIKAKNTFIPLIHKLFGKMTSLPSNFYYERLKYTLEHHFRTQTEDDCSIAISSIIRYPKEDDLRQLAQLIVQYYHLENTKLVEVETSLIKLIETLSFPATLAYIKTVTQLMPHRIYQMVHFLQQIRWLKQHGDTYHLQVIDWRSAHE